MDWNDKIDMNRPVTVEELGADLPQQFTLRYQPGDGSVARWDSANKEILGQWSAPILNRFAKEGKKTYYTPPVHPIAEPNRHLSRRPGRYTPASRGP